MEQSVGVQIPLPAPILKGDNMIKCRTEMIEQKIPESITCDVCKKEYNCKKGERGNDDIMEVQEFNHIRFQGGFNSIFRDGVVMKIDICQHCLKKLLGEYMVEESVEDNDHI